MRYEAGTSREPPQQRLRELQLDFLEPERFQEAHRVDVNVLARDERAVEGDHVDADPRHLFAGRLDGRRALRERDRERAARGPLLRHDAVAHVGAAGVEPDVGEGRKYSLEDSADRGLAHGLAAARVVLEDRILGMQREDRLDVVTVPGLAVGGDHRLERMRVTHPLLSATTSPETGSVRPRPAPRSSSMPRMRSRFATIAGRDFTMLSMLSHSPTMQYARSPVLIREKRRMPVKSRFIA